MLYSSLNRRHVLKLAGAAALAGAGLGRRMPVRAADLGMYEVVDIGQTDPDASSSTWVGVNDMNSHGVVAGNMWISEEKRSPWVLSNGKMRRIKTGTYGGLLAAINDNGMVVGRDILGWSAPGKAWGLPVRWVDGDKQELPLLESLAEDVDRGRAVAINNDGVTVGVLENERGASYPVVWRDGEPTLLPSYFESGQGAAAAINNAGQIVGTLDDGKGGELGVIWTGEALAPLWGIPGADGPVRLRSIDDNGIITGSGWSGYRWEALVWFEGPSQVPVILPEVVPAQSEAVVISGNGAGVFGGGVMTADGEQHAALWADGVAIDLNAQVTNLNGMQLLIVRSIGADGTIAVSARCPDGAIHAVMLNPASA
jgi:uncharacterized membrane protein